MVAVTVEAMVDAPCPRVGVTITGLGVGDSLVSLWRTADGVRSPVRGARRVIMNDATFVVDYDAPLGRPVAYELEVISGPAGASRTISESVQVDSDSAWIMDPLVPQSAVPISRRMTRAGKPVFMVSAMREFEYKSNVQMFNVMGSDRPMVLMGQRAAAAGINLSLVADMAEQNTRIRNLFMQSPQVLVRVPKSVTDVIEGSCFLAVALVGEESRKAHTGSELTTWTITGDTTQAPTIRVLTASFTYGDVAILTATYQQKQDAMAGKTYLDDLKNPLGG
jgi:hypothetical protein